METCQGARPGSATVRGARPESLLSLATSWGTRPDERAGVWPCDRLAPPEAASLWRGIGVRAPAERVYRWLCQLRAAPYSYDWIDNRGRRSPRTLTPGLERLAPGQRVMEIFELASFAWGDHLTLATPEGGRGERLFGRIWCSYRVVPESEAACRLLVKLRVARAPGVRGWLLARLLAWGDLVMMRKQLRTLARLAERGGEP
jgi:hypothetical protein